MIQPGSKLAHYEVVSALGKGGMGEVWRARDSKLEREVAIKTLPAEFAQDEERLARFEREAKLLASLNHPNIAAIHGFDEDNGTHFLVMELVEGDTLADRVGHGAIPVEESLKLALQIAEALAAAHEKGVIHRDLKPANIKVTPDNKIKVLDFGLAKAFSGDAAEDNAANSPTLSMAATQQGMILGTAAYMAPEQAKGQTVGKRADVWAFGCVLYEMLTGRQVFAAEDVSTILARVLDRDPDFTTLPKNLHPRLSELLEGCLQKNPGQRYHDIADVRLELEKVLAGPGGLIVEPAIQVAAMAEAPPQPKWPWVAAIVLTGLVALIAGFGLRPSEPGPVSRSDYELPDGINFRSTGRSVVAISPDGRYFVYNGTGGLYLRAMDELDARPIAGTEGDLTNPVFSPDSQWVAFWDREGQIEKIEVSGGTPIRVGAAEGNPQGISWGVDDTLLFAQAGGIYSVSANGGTPELIIEARDGELSYGPQLLPDDKGILFTVREDSADRDSAQIVVQSIDTPPDRKVVWNGSDGRYVSTGHLIYALNDDLFAIAFDLDTLETRGSAVSLEQRVARSANSGTANYGVSDDGTLVYRVGTEANLAGADRSLVWVDPDGREELFAVPSGDYEWARVSPDGTEVAVYIDGENVDVWIADVERGTIIKLTTNAAFDGFPIWSPDGDRVVFWSNRENAPGLYWRAADGTGVEELLAEFEEEVRPFDWSADGSLLVFEYGVGEGRDIGVLTMEDASWTPLLDSEAAEYAPAISPDGEWIAYTSTETGGQAVYVQRFPGLGNRRQVSIGLGTEPTWSPGGDKLFYFRGAPNGPADGMMGVTVSTEPTLTLGTTPEIQFERTYSHQRGQARLYDIAPVGNRFLMVSNDGGQTESGSPQIIVVQNWFEELKERVPVP